MRGIRRLSILTLLSAAALAVLAFALAAHLHRARAQEIEPQMIAVRVDNMRSEDVSLFTRGGPYTRRLGWAPAETITDIEWRMTDLLTGGVVQIDGEAGTRWEFPTRKFLVDDNRGCLICLCRGDEIRIKVYKLAEPLPTSCDPEDCRQKAGPQQQAVARGAT